MSTLVFAVFSLGCRDKSPQAKVDVPIDQTAADSTSESDKARQSSSASDLLKGSERLVPAGISSKWTSAKGDSTLTYDTLFDQYRSSRRQNSTLDPHAVSIALCNAAQVEGFAPYKSVFASTVLEEVNVATFVKDLHSFITEHSSSFQDQGRREFEALSILGERLAKWTLADVGKEQSVSPIICFAGVSCLERSLASVENLSRTQGDLTVATQCESARQNLKLYTAQLKKKYGQAE